VQTVTGNSFASRVLESSVPVAVEFMSYGCEHCRLLEPILQGLARKLGARALVFRVNTAIDQDLESRYEIGGTPTLVMFSGGAEVGRTVGPDPSVGAVRDAITGAFAGLA
jgi:thioredoxin 1